MRIGDPLGPGSVVELLRGLAPFAPVRSNSLVERIVRRVPR
jgi:hypothetical protein